MKRLISWLNIIIRKRKAVKRWKRIVTVFAAVITFATTYALILPAITVERDKTEEVAGMYLEKVAQDDMLEENALEPVGFGIAADQENAVTYTYTDEDMTATAIFSTNEEIPEEAELVVNLIDPESEEYANFSRRSAGLLDKEFIYDVTTCSFYDFALICENVDVTPETGLVDLQIIFRTNTVEHVNDIIYAGRYARPTDVNSGLVEMAAGDRTEAAETAAGDTLGADQLVADSGDYPDVQDELVSVNPDESSVIELSDGIITVLSLKGSDLARSDSIVGILAGHVDEEVKAAAAETDAEVPAKNESQEENALVDSSDVGEEEDAPAVKTLEAAGNDYTVTLSYDATSRIPEGALLTVSEIAQDSEEYQAYLKETKKAMGLTEEETLPRYAARFFGIKIMVGDEEFTPESGVSVEITYAEPLAEKNDAEVNAVHFANEKAEAEVIEANTSDVQEDGTATVEFIAESFSVYGVIYTVDFEWEVDGKTYTFTLPGGGYVSFGALMEILGVADDDVQNDSDAEETKALEVAPENEQDDNLHAEDVDSLTLNNVEISGQTKRFLADVESVVFSDPSLVWVGKVDTETTVQQLKEEHELEVEYSGDLTEEQKEEINAQTVGAGDWALISLLPFDTEECLRITMKDGKAFTVKVTDENTPAPAAAGNPPGAFYGEDTTHYAVKINLIDYGPTNNSTNPNQNLDCEQNNLQNNPNSNLGINQGHALKFFSYGKKPSDVGQTAMGINHFSGGAHAVQGIVENTLTGGYPKLNGGEPLDYLFDESENGTTKQVYKNVTCLFQEDANGKFFYDSNNNYAYYNPDKGDNGKVVLGSTFDEEGSDWGVGFFPFDGYDDYYNCIHGDGITWCGSGNKAGHYNHHFGMYMTIDFMMSSDHKRSGDDMVLSFRGDDDMWIFVDDVLLMDVGGVHNPVGGWIDFTHQTVHVDSAIQIGNGENSGQAVNKTFAEIFAAAGKTWDNNAFSEHTVKIFYMERGGCYSNLQLEFNLTRYIDYEFYKKDQNGDGVPGAKFTLYKQDGSRLVKEVQVDNNGNEIGRTYFEAVSDANGRVYFDHVPLGKYEIREMETPEGYLSNDITYRAILEVTEKEDAPGQYDANTYLEKMVGGTATRVDPPEVENIKIEQLEIGVDKLWTGDAPNGATAEFALRRCRSYEGDIVIQNPATTSTINVYRVNRNWGNPALLRTGEFESNTTASVSWEFPSHYQGTNNQYRINNSTVTQYSNSHSISVTMPSSGSINIYIRDDNRDTQYDGAGLEIVSISGTTVSPTITQHVVVVDEPDTEYNEDSPTIIISSGDNWSGSFEPQPSVGKRNGIIETYTYYVEEIGLTNATGYRPVYVDSSGQIVSEPASPGLDSSGTMTVYNVQYIDVPVNKSWEWSDSDAGRISSWSATFYLQYREEYVSGTPDATENVQSLWTYVYDGNRVKQVPITNDSPAGDSGSDSFEDLPKYKIHANGSVYRLIYAVDEVEYTINYNDGTPAANWTKNDTSLNFDEHYAPAYDEDAAQAGDAISLTNAPAVGREQNSISMGVEKIWEDEDGEILQDPPDTDYSATFKLKRYYHEEYLDLSPYASSQMVTVTLDLGDGCQSVLEVPSGAPVYITADMYNGGSVNLTFTRTLPNSSATPVILNSSNTAQATNTDDAVVFVVSDPVIHPTGNETWTLVQPEGEGAADAFKDILGGVDGIRLATFDHSPNPDFEEFSYDITGEIFDDTYEEEFELNNDNDWAKVWEKLPQVIENKITRSNGKDYLITTVYSYYFEEVGCDPPEYYAVFRDHNNSEVRYGDELSRVEISGLTIDAINKAAPETQLYKVDIEKLDGDLDADTIDKDCLTGASFQIKKYVKFAEQAGETEVLDETWGTQGVKNAVLVNEGQDNGIFRVDGLGPGDYEIDEIDYPKGYIQTSNNPRFQVILKPETETLEIVPWNADGTIDVIDADSDHPNIIVVGNQPGAALPNTGGSGTSRFYLIGSILTMLAGAGIVMKRRRRLI